MFIPVGTFMQYIEQVDKDERGEVSSKRVMGVSVSFKTKDVHFWQTIHTCPLVCSPNRQIPTKTFLRFNPGKGCISTTNLHVFVYLLDRFPCENVCKGTAAGIKWLGMQVLIWKINCPIRQSNRFCKPMSISQQKCP